MSGDRTKRILGAIVWGGGGISTLLIAAAQISPEDAGSHLSGWAKRLGFSRIPQWLAATGADRIATVIGIAVAVIAIGSLAAWLVARRQQSARSVPTTAPPTDAVQAEMISLPEAARLLYEHAREKAPTWGRAAEGLSGWKNDHMADGSPQDILDWMATYISGKMSFYGSRPPSARRELIAEKSGHFEDGGLIYKTDRHVYTDLAISKRDVPKLLEMLTE